MLLYHLRCAWMMRRARTAFAGLAWVATLSGCQPTPRDLRLPNGEVVRLLPAGPTLRRVSTGIPAIVVRYVTPHRDPDSVAVEFHRTLLPTISAEALRRRNSVILVQASRPIMLRPPVYIVTDDVYLRYELRDGTWESAPFEGR